jgi:hypothetical protein
LLLQIAEEIDRSLARAEEARQQALRETSERLTAEWLEIEKRWLHIADSLRFVEQANRFLDDAAAAVSKGQTP